MGLLTLLQVRVADDLTIVLEILIFSIAQFPSDFDKTSIFCFQSVTTLSKAK